MSSPLPSNMALTTVRGRYGTWSTTPGQPEPQFTPFVGMRVSFSPAYPFVTNNTALPSPVVVATAPRIFQTDAEGYLADPAAGFTGLGIGNNRNCQIVSSDDPDIYPRDWKYLITFTGPGGTNFRSFRTPAPSGSIIDMAIITPQRVTSGSAPNAAEIAAANAAASAAAAQDAVASINKGQAGGVAPLDADGDVNNAFGVKVLPGAGGGGGGSSNLAGITDMSGTARLFNAAITGGHATTQAEMRAAIGAGTGNGTGNSNLVLGTTAGTAADAAAVATAIGQRALADVTVNVVGDQFIDGIKTFLDPVIVPTATASDQAVNKAQLDEVAAATTFAPDSIPQTAVTGLVTGLAAKAATTYVDSLIVQEVRILCPGDIDQPRLRPNGQPLSSGQYARFIKKNAPANALVNDEWTVRDF